jgi:cytochrome c oxidase cbb3-type subunit 3
MSSSKKHDPIQGEIIHEYDGIQEADNRLPQWWLFTFYSAVLFAVGYWFYYEEFKAGAGPLQAYLAEKAAVDEKNGVDPTEGELMALSTGPTRDLGKQLFATNCVACHADQGQGKIGPNLTDGAWLHGGAPLAIFKTVRDGVPAKGMPAWGPTLGRAGVSQVVSFVLTLRNTNVPGKAAEGQTEAAQAPGASETHASSTP